MCAPVPEWFFRGYSADKARREAVVWRRLDGAICQKCGKEAMTGTLDGAPIILACTHCGTSMGAK